jgi:2-oxoglutarate dehydrogenase E2 component (dihydrolipoamide succinyltransferase)
MGTSATVIDVRLPEGQQEGSASALARWLVAPGAAVDAHQPIAEIETDKVMVELAAPAGGRLVEILKEAGDPVSPGDVLARIDTGADPTSTASARAGTARPGAAVGTATPGATAMETATPGTRIAVSRDERLSPAVKRLLAEHGLDAAQVTGSGRDGRITADDVLRFSAARGQGAEAPAARAQPGGPAASAQPAAQIPSRRVPHDAMRRRVAAHMVESLLHTAPHVTSVFEADLSAALAHRDAHKTGYAERGVRLTLTAYFVEAACKALLAVPEVNARWHADALEIFDDVNIGVGTALEDRGLIVPVIRRVQALDLLGIARRLDELTRAAREGRLLPADVQGGTFTISNHGVGGSLVATPIVINQPQVAILGIGKVQKRAVVREVAGEERIVVRPMAYVTLSIDHRALDAFQTNAFLSALVTALESC